MLKGFAFAFAFLAAMALPASCSMQTVNRIDPPIDPKYCPMQCPRGCCQEGSADDGFVCVNPEEKDPGVCQWTGLGVGPGDPNGSGIYGKKLARDAGR